MKFFWIITLILAITSLVDASIAGVTYHDDFDFEERYHKNDCDPMYYYPLHPPERCGDIYEKLIRQKLGHYGPLPIQPDAYAASYPGSPIIHYQSDPIPLPNRLEDIPPAPYEELFKHLTADILKDPKKPEVVMTNIGPVAVYEQKVSEKSEKMIMDLVKEREQKSGSRTRTKNKRRRNHHNHHH